MKKVKLQFMAVPEQLKVLAYVPDAIRVKIIDPEAIFLTGLLGESGKKLVKAGVEFYFTKKLADKLIKKRIAKKVIDKFVKYKTYKTYKTKKRCDYKQIVEFPSRSPFSPCGCARDTLDNNAY